ncbi:MAG TPA: ADYC domain-containing protein [Kofleriaceae bacterium]|nr:ADYC domain-containing protein [Kofleriaceae bacterium]
MRRNSASQLWVGMKNVIAAFALTSCTSPGVDVGAVESSIKPGDQDCPIHDCGTNSTIIDGVYFSDLNLHGAPNGSGIVFDGYESLPAGAVALDVRGNKLVAVNAANATVAGAEDLVGTVFRLRNADKSYHVRIAAMQRSSYWAANHGRRVEVYRFQYSDPAALGARSPRELCVSDNDSGVLALDAVVFAGDRYDPSTKDVDPTPGSGWINIACLGGAPAKMHLMRHTAASQDPHQGITTTENERQALFNAWTGNYCGDGRSFTRTGEKVRIRDSQGWLAYDSGRSWADASELSSYEAIWNETGAVCLNVPRLEDSEPGTYNEILAWCSDVGHPLPPCSATPDSYPAGWQQTGHILTANPVGS